MDTTALSYAIGIAIVIAVIVISYLVLTGTLSNPAAIFEPVTILFE
jgi:glycerol uptake facilitator-like aquaporin